MAIFCTENTKVFGLEALMFGKRLLSIDSKLLQEISRLEDGDAPEGVECEQVWIARDNAIRL